MAGPCSRAACARKERSAIANSYSLRQSPGRHSCSQNQFLIGPSVQSFPQVRGSLSRLIWRAQFGQWSCLSPSCGEQVFLPALAAVASVDDDSARPVTTYAANTCAILGALTFSMFLIPRLGTQAERVLIILLPWPRFACCCLQLYIRVRRAHRYSQLRCSSPVFWP